MIRNLLCVLLCAAPLFATAEEPWRGKWIASERTVGRTNEWVCYRKVARLEAVPRTATARIAADSKYWLWINDSLVVFEGSLKRGPTPADTYYDEVEIAPYLRPGDNTIAVLLWHFGKNGFSHVNSGMAALLFDAPAAGIFSDRSWSCRVNDAYGDTGHPQANHRLPESNIRFDARRELQGWNRSDFPHALDEALIIADAGAAPFNRLIKRPIPLWKDYGLKSYPDTAWNASRDTLTCTLPYNCHVTPYLRVKAPAGCRIDIFTDNLYGGSEPNVRAEYITREGEQEYESYGWMNGHKMIYVLPRGVELLDVKFRETGYDTRMAGSFACDDPFYDRLWQKSLRTLYVTMRDNYMDCPDRERAQWWGDEVNELGETFYALCPRSHALALKGIYELMNWQRSDGTIFSPVPSGIWRKELPLQMLASVGWFGFYTQYLYSGDGSFVPAVYDRMHRYLHEVWQTDGEGFPLVRPGEWSWGDWGENIDMEVLTAAWYYLALKGEREFARMLGKQEDAAEISTMMRRIEQGFDARFWSGEAYRSAGYSGQTDDRSQAMAVVSGLAPAERYPELLATLRREYHASPYMEKYVLEALFRMGYADFALQRMKERYAKQVDHPDYTTLWEGWGIGAEGFGGGTINHAWSGGPLTLLSQYVCGIAPVEAGFARFRIAPQLGTLRHAAATVESVRGTIRADIRRTGAHRMRIAVSVPEGCRAEILFPEEIRRVSCNGRTTQGRSITLAAGDHTVEGR